MKNFNTMSEGGSDNKGRLNTTKVPLSPILDARNIVKLQIRGENHPLGNAFGNIDM